MPLVQNASLPAEEPNHDARLDSPEPEARRRAAAMLREPADVPQLAEALARETDRSVQSALLDALCEIADSKAAEAIAPLLGSEETGLRNGAVTALKSFGQNAEQALKQALTNQDPDVRIMALDVMQDVRIENISEWLVQIIETDAHANVVGTALDRLVEIGTPAHADAIRRAELRFQDDPFIAFAASRAMNAIMRDTP